ncbi:hypothetical protein N7501_007592, partial [Penicillium viridicatum]
IVENPVFQRLLSLLYSSPGELELPSAKTLRKRLRDTNYREIFLGFKPLYGPYTGNNLSNILYRLLEERKLLDRIFSVTIDNATNNDTIIYALQERLLSIRAISSRESIVRVPCIAHIIQLYLKQLLGYIRAAPKNKESDTQAHGLKDSINYRDIAYTLTKIRSFAIFVNLKVTDVK